ncbi:MAG: pyrroloquinoline quinone biosynthesis protein PqqB [Crocinitomicaceae bacterium]|nr:pyrroloquinoline quinone biosynthesis protein PqqB [Crocinitomicaceae bacterium]
MRLLILVLVIISSLCNAQQVQLVVLGVAQDAGFPQAGCSKTCCTGGSESELVSCLAVVKDSNFVILDATPDFKAQLKNINEFVGNKKQKLPESILLTHAHIGHYTGLMQLGREVMGTQKQVVYAMPRMQSFLEMNGPWSQLVKLQNIELKPLMNNKGIDVLNGVEVVPIQVPHRDEFSETVGFIINSGKKKAVFIPDIDKWEKWEVNIDSLIKVVDYAFIDGTFFSNGELPGRDMSEIPHPFIEESMSRFQGMNTYEKKKIYFIHFNHTNPVMWDKKSQKQVQNAGFNVAEQGMVIDL